MNDIDKKHLLEKFGRKLTYERELRGLSQQALSGMTGISLLRLINIERGTVEVRLNVLVALLTALDIKASELLEEIPNKPPHIVR